MDGVYFGEADEICSVRSTRPDSYFRYLLSGDQSVPEEERAYSDCYSELLLKVEHAVFMRVISGFSLIL